MLLTLDKSITPHVTLVKMTIINYKYLQTLIYFVNDFMKSALLDNAKLLFDNHLRILNIIKKYPSTTIT